LPPRMLLKGLAMASDPRVPERLPRTGTWAGTFPRQLKWRAVGLAAVLISLLSMGRQAEADEFDPLVAYREALAGGALHHCPARQEALSRFFVAKIGSSTAASVMMVLRDKYRAGLRAEIEELRTRD